MRSDLAVSRHDSGGWVVKDPVGLNYALLDDAEFTILNLLDGRTTLSAMMNNVRRKFPASELSPDDIADFIRVLAVHQLIRQTSSGDHRRLHSSKQANLYSWIFRCLANILRLQVPLCNPTRFIKATLPFVSFVFSPRAIAFAGFVVAMALAMVLLRFGELQKSLPGMAQFLGPQNILIVLAIFVVVKVLHEAGHAFTARYFGAECNECGIMLLILTPVLYTNVTDAWTLGRRQRMLVTAAGIMVELFVASVCTLLWWTATDGLARSILLNTMLLCSFNTVLFNGNPLLRFDGYFLLADWVGIPNLASRASLVVHSFFFQLLTGVAQPCHESHRHRRFLLCYGLAAITYRIVLTLAILQLVRYVSRQWQLEIAGNIVSVVLLFGALVMPMLSFIATATAAENVNRYNRASYLRMAASLVVILLILLYPFPESIVAPAIVQPDSISLYASLPGRIQPVARYGDRVSANQTIAVLHNPDLQSTLQSYSAKADSLNIQLQVLLRDVQTANSELIPSLKKSIRAAEEQQQSFATELQKLTIISPREGKFFEPPAVEKGTRPDLPQQWFGTPAETKNTNAWIERGTLLGFVGDEWDLKLLACVTEKEIEGLMPDQQVSFYSNSGGTQIITGRVSEVSRIPVDELPQALSVSGLVQGQPTSRGLVPLETSYYVVVQLDESQSTTPPALYSVGRVRIGIRSTSLLQRVTRFLRQTF